MSDEISLDDTKEGVAGRDDSGNLIPETHTVELPNGKTVTIKTKPITTGLLNELSGVDDAIANLDPEAVREAFQKIYVSEAILNLSVADIRDTKAEYLTAYLQPLNDAVEEDIGESESDTPNPADTVRDERARQMRQ